MLHAIRRVLDEHELPVVLMVSRAAGAGGAGGLPAGVFADYVERPPRPAELLVRIAMQLRMREAARLHEEARTRTHTRDTECMTRSVRCGAHLCDIDV